MGTVLGIMLVYNTLNGNLFRALGEGAEWLSDKLSDTSDE